MRISAKSCSFPPHSSSSGGRTTSSREKSPDDAFQSFFVSFGLKHFASLSYTQKINTIHTLHTSKAKNEWYGALLFARCDDDNNDAIVFVEHRVVVVVVVKVVVIC